MKRKEAFALNLTKYSTGRPCSKGHNADRYVASGVCVQCAADRQKVFKRPSSLLAVRHTVLVYKDDIPMVDAFVAALTMQRRADERARIELATSRAGLGFFGEPHANR